MTANIDARLGKAEREFLLGFVVVWGTTSGGAPKSDEEIEREVAERSGGRAARTVVVRWKTPEEAQ